MAKLFKEKIEQAILNGCSVATSEFVYIDIGHVMAIIGKDKTVEICKIARGLEEVELMSEAEIHAGGEPEIKELGIGKFDRIELLETMGYEVEVKPEDRPEIVVPKGVTRKAVVKSEDGLELPNKVVVNSSTVSADAARNVTPVTPAVPTPNPKTN